MKRHRRTNECIWVSNSCRVPKRQLNEAEVVANCDHLRKLKFSKSLPHAFIEHRVIQAANVLASPQAIDMGIDIVRAFVRLREMAATHGELSRGIDELEHKAEALARRNDDFSRNTRAELRQVFNALRAQMAQPEPPRRPIGFVTPGHASRKAPAS